MLRKMCLLALTASLPLHAGTMGTTTAVDENPWYASIGTGFSWTQLPGIDNPDPSIWDASAQGYNSSLGNRGFYTFEVGKQVHQYIDVSVMYMNHETFNYQMFQSGTSNTMGFTGDQRNRYFNLNNRSLLVSGFLHPDHSVYQLSTVNMKPFIGAGIGYALNQVNNFYTVGSTLVNGTAIGSTDSIGNKVNTNSFAWQGSVGLNFSPENSHLSLDAGYRYYDGGKFNTSNHIYVQGASGFGTSVAWSGKLQANQLFIDLKYTV